MKRLGDRLRGRRILHEPGLPPLVQEAGLGEGWDTAFRLPALYALTRGLRARPPREHLLAEFRQRGEVLVHLDTAGQWPSGMQLLNFSWLAAEDEAVAAALLAAIRERHPSRALFRSIRLELVTIHPIPHASTPYLGFEFSCAWDEEHGLGALTCGTEILDVGTADVSASTATAQEHRDAHLARLQQ